MELNADWTYGILIVLILCSFIECSIKTIGNVTGIELNGTAKKNHSSEIMSRYTYVEKYQLPGGKITWK
jgi:hypothetical protein